MYDPDQEQPVAQIQQEPVEDARAFSTFIHIIEDGDFHVELSNALRDLNAEMNDHFRDTGGTAKGKLKIEIDFTLKDGLFVIHGKYDVKHPPRARRQTIAWSTPGNNFSPNNPKQMNMFDRPRDVTTHDRTEIKTIA